MQNVLKKLGLEEENAGVFDGAWCGSGEKIDKISPIDGKKIASFRTASAEEYERAIARAHEAFQKWRVTPGPVRGETVRRLGNALREAKTDLATLVTWENGKIIAEGEGEVQEMIDICDFAVGQSRMLYGLTIQSERASHRLMEQWQPLGIVAVISAFNFPVAVGRGTPPSRRFVVTPPCGSHRKKLHSPRSRSRKLRSGCAARPELIRPFSPYSSATVKRWGKN